MRRVRAGVHAVSKARPAHIRLFADRTMDEDRGRPVVRICKRFVFDAAHWLPRVADGHKCKRMHGHTYAVEIVCEGDVDEEDGMLIDYARIDEVWARIFDLIDHRVLNEVRGLENPTTEVLASWIVCELCDSPISAVLAGVRVYESSASWCEVGRV